MTLVETKTVLAKLTFEGWENFGTKQQRWIEPSILSESNGVFFVNNKKISKEEAQDFINYAKIELSHGLKNAEISSFIRVDFGESFDDFFIWEKNKYIELAKKNGFEREKFYFQGNFEFKKDYFAEPKSIFLMMDHIIRDLDLNIIASNLDEFVNWIESQF